MGAFFALMKSIPSGYYLCAGVVAVGVALTAWVWATAQKEVLLKDAAEDLSFAQQMERANRQADQSAARASDEHAREAARITGDVNDGRRQIQNHTAAPAPGTVGRGALVDPGIGQPLLCRVERLRNEAPSEACGRAAR